MNEIGEFRDKIKAALVKVGHPVTSKELYGLIGTEEPRSKVMAVFSRMIAAGTLKKLPGNGPRSSVYALVGGAVGDATPRKERDPKNTKSRK